MEEGMGGNCSVRNMHAHTFPPVHYTTPTSVHYTNTTTTHKQEHAPHDLRPITQEMADDPRVVDLLTRKGALRRADIKWLRRRLVRNAPAVEEEGEEEEEKGEGEEEEEDEEGEEESGDDGRSE